MSPQTYLQRAKALNVKERAELAKIAFGWLALAMLPGFAGLAFLAGLNWPMPEREYDLIAYHGAESDIVDYGLSTADCADAIQRMRAAGLNVTCELPR
ncbi:hypothetical protein [Sinorhizobium meliloti]|uniref:hypothetical protein n=1 Tax=Rhizobium meliloti TaxID=382 RepID=UPI0001E4B028|nr:hypothetical protein [Sinorhizobium meliloti]AEG53167.1 hypothetical protein Sinme_1421 [Sinorhizobium meliloti AK83]MDE4591117.1 hypothetical protein [Sinorhizobium meliloti]SEI56426.1 hypothetical protein SAMN04244575_01070 [Sinorhizobium meliloti]